MATIKSMLVPTPLHGSREWLLQNEERQDERKTKDGPKKKKKKDGPGLG